MGRRSMEPPMSYPYNDRDRPDWTPVFYGQLRQAIRRLASQIEQFREPIRELTGRVAAIERNQSTQGEKLVATQAEIDALVGALNDLDAKLTAEDGELNSAVAAIQGWIANQPPAVDVSGLQAAVASLSTANDDLKASVDNAASLVPAPAEPTA